MPPALLQPHVHLAEQRVVAVEQVRNRAVRLLRPRDVAAQKVERLLAAVPVRAARDLAQPRLRQQRAPLLPVSEVGLEGGAEVGRFDHGLEDQRVETVLHVQKHAHFVRITIVFPNHDVTPRSQHTDHFLQKGLDFWNVVEHHINGDHIETVVTIRKRHSVIMLKQKPLALVGLGRQVAHVAAEDVVAVESQVGADGDADAAVRAADVQVVADGVWRQAGVGQHVVELVMRTHTHPHVTHAGLRAKRLVLRLLLLAAHGLRLHHQRHGVRLLLLRSCQQGFHFLLLFLLLLLRRFFRGEEVVVQGGVDRGVLLLQGVGAGQLRIIASSRAYLLLDDAEHLLCLRGRTALLLDPLLRPLLEIAATLPYRLELLLADDRREVLLSRVLQGSRIQRSDRRDEGHQHGL